MKSFLFLSLLLFPQAAPPDPGALERKAVELETRGKFAEAVPLLRKALELREKKLGPYDQLVGRTLYNLSYALSQAGRSKEALEAGRRALAVARRAGDPSPGTAMTRRNLAEICERAGLLTEARKLAERAVEDFEKVGGRNLDSAGAREYAGRLAFQAGDLEGAKDHWTWALAVYERLLGRKFPEKLGPPMTGLASVLAREGRPDAALALHRRALGLLQGRDPRGVRTNLEAILALLLSLGEREEAGRVLDALFGKIPARERGRALPPEALLGRARLRLSLGRPGEAEAWLDLLPSGSGKEPARIEGFRRLLLARALAMEGKWKEAGSECGAARRLLGGGKKRGFHPDLVELDLLEGEILQALGRPNRAFGILRPLMEDQRALLGEDSPRLAATFLGLAGAELDSRGCTPELLDFLEMAEASLAHSSPEGLAAGLREDRWMWGRSAWDPLLRGWARLAQRKPGRLPRAFRALDRLRERSLLEGFAPWAGRDALENPSLRKYLALLEAEARGEYPPEKRGELGEKFLNTARALSFSGSPWAEMLAPGGAGPAQVRAALGKGDVLARFVRTSRRLWCFLVSKDPRREGVFDLGPSKAIESLLARYLAGDEAVLPDLSRSLLGPLWKVLPGKGTLVVVPDGLLAFLPFEALSAPGGRPLALRLRIVYAVSAGEWTRRAKGGAGRGKGEVQFLAEKEKGRGRLPYRFGLLWKRFYPGRKPGPVEGLPPLGGVKAEFYGEAGLREWMASKTREETGILHFRVPTFIDGTVPAAACLRLGPGERNPALSLWDRPDGVLTLGEILRLPLEGRVVVLWGGREGPGGAERRWRPEGLFCLARAFLAAGARGVLLSDRPAGGKEGERFDALLLEELRRGRPEEALVSAQRKWLESAGTDTVLLSPRVWARFRWWE